MTARKPRWSEWIDQAKALELVANGGIPPDVYCDELWHRLYKLGLTPQGAVEWLRSPERLSRDLTP